MVNSRGLVWGEWWWWCLVWFGLVFLGWNTSVRTEEAFYCILAWLCINKWYCCSTWTTFQVVAKLKQEELCFTFSQFWMRYFLLWHLPSIRRFCLWSDYKAERRQWNCRMHFSLMLFPCLTHTGTGWHPCWVCWQLQCYSNSRVSFLILYSEKMTFCTDFTHDE